MGQNIDTLKKITYTTMDTFLEDLNRNFAVIQNSPLYKGVPGQGGPEGDDGTAGTRGSSFIFVSLQSFQAIFPNELQAGSDISLIYLNSKLGTFENQQLLMQALGVTQLVDKDIVVLTNTEMLSYSYGANTFSDTGIAFNQQTSLAASIEQEIETYVAYYVQNSSVINSIKNIFSDFQSLGKNYPDTNNTFTTTSITGSTVYSPYIPGYNSQIGVPITNHKYFGFQDNEFPVNNAGTTVFGSIKQYYNMLMATVSTDGNNTLNSAYAPGVNNIPSAIFLQDTYNNGLLVGYKGKANLRNFGSIYKNEVDEFVIQSDAGSQDSEYSKLLLHATYMKYAKIVYFMNDLQVSRDLTVGGDLDTKAVNTGKYTAGASSGNSFNSGVSEFGVQESGSVNKSVATTEQWPNYPSAVLVADSVGNILKSYGIETAAENGADLVDLAPITVIPNSSHSILTSNYFSFLAQKINAVTTYAANNYWRKNQFNTGEISDITTSDSLNTTGNTNLSAMLTLVKNTGIATLTANQFIDNSVAKKYGFFKGNVFVTDANGNLSQSYFLDTIYPPDSEITSPADLPIYSTSSQTLISTYHYAHLAQKINANNSNLAANYWSKAQFSTFAIPNLALSGDLSARGSVDFSPNGGSSVFHIDNTAGSMTIGSTTSQVVVQTNSLKLQQFPSNVIVTDGAGNVVNTYSIETNQFASGDQADANPITVNVTSGSKIPTSANVGWLATKLNNFMAWVQANYWNRTQLSNGSVSDIRATNSIKSDNILQAGNSSDTTFSANGSTAVLGKSNGSTTIRGSVINFANQPSIVLTTDASGNLTGSYTIETAKPVYTSQSDITNNYWATGASAFDTVASSAGGVVTSDMFLFIMRNFNSVRQLLFNRPTYAELNSVLPSGSIIMWTNKTGSVPSNFTICDGRALGGSGGLIFTDNLIDKFIKGSLTPAVDGGNAGHQQVLVTANLAAHGHNVTVDAGGLHTHNVEVGGGHTHTLALTRSPYHTYGSGSDTPYISGPGAQDILGTSNQGSHSHVIDYDGTHSHTATADAAGSGTAFSVEPQSYTAIFIMKN
jgi:hypothetical protein